MLQRARGAIALLSGFLLAGSCLVQASSGLNSDPTALAQEPVLVSTPLGPGTSLSLYPVSRLNTLGEVRSRVRPRPPRSSHPGPGMRQRPRS